MQFKNLHAYLVNEELSFKEFADMIGYDDNYIGQVARGAITAGEKLAKKVEIATNGMVKLKTNPKVYRPRGKIARRIKEEMLREAAAEAVG